MRRQQDVALASVDAPEPVYRWTTALNGFAVRLGAAQARTLAAEPGVALVEPEVVRRLAGTPGRGLATQRLTGPRHTHGGAGTVIGFVDSGIWPESPLFSDVPGLGRSPRAFRGDCVGGEDWPAGSCDGKLVGARWFVDGFGADRVRTSSSLSPRDDDGHGSQMASIAAGNARRHGAGERPAARQLRRRRPAGAGAAYKACWTAPNPADDGCATADLVTAIDRPTRDRVDVLNLSVGGPDTFDTVERALLGAAEADIVVVAAAGNHGGRSFAAHPGPWVTTVGSTTGVVRRGRVRLGGGPRRSTARWPPRRGVGPARVVVGSTVAARDATRAQARVCRPGSLDAVAGPRRDRALRARHHRPGRQVRRRRRGRRRGHGAAPTPGPGRSTPTSTACRPSTSTGPRPRTLRRWLAAHPRGRVVAAPASASSGRRPAGPWSARGDPTAAILKPDVVAPGVGVLGAVPPSVRSTRWDFASGTSAAAGAPAEPPPCCAAATAGRPTSSGRRSRPPRARCPAGRRSAIGAGRLRIARSAVPGLAYSHRPDGVPRLAGGPPRGSSTRRRCCSRAAEQRPAHHHERRPAGHVLLLARLGFDRHDVRVSPAAVRLAPGEAASFVIRVVRAPGALRLDAGAVVWRGATGTRTRIPVLLSR